MTEPPVTDSWETDDRPLLSVEDLVVEYPTPQGPLRAVDQVGFRVPHGGSLAVVGESGCG